MQEDIKILEDKLKNIKENIFFEYTWTTRDLEILTNLVSEYRETLARNKELEENYIPKSKVREKIEELRNEEYDDITFKYNRIEVNGIIEVVLEELLED